MKGWQSPLGTPGLFKHGQYKYVPTINYYTDSGEIVFNCIAVNTSYVLADAKLHLSGGLSTI